MYGWLVLFLITFVPPVWAETFKLKSGTEIEGRILELTATTVTIERLDGMVYDVQRDDLKRETEALLETFAANRAEIQIPEHSTPPPAPIVEIDYSEVGRQAAQNGDCASAVQAFTKVIETDPSNAEAYAYRGYCYAVSQLLEAAIQDIETALKLNPAATELRKMLGYYYLQTDRPQEGYAYFESYLQEFPEDAEGVYGFALSLYGLQMFTDAKAALDKAVRLGYLVPPEVRAEIGKAAQANPAPPPPQPPRPSVEQPKTPADLSNLTPEQMRAIMPKPWMVGIALVIIAILTVLFSKTNSALVVEFRKAGPNKRVCAYLIDSYICSIVGLIPIIFGVPWASAVLTAVYLWIRDGFSGQSLGKRMVGIQVLDFNNAPGGKKQSIVRNALLAFSSLLSLIDPLLGYAMVIVLIAEYISMLMSPEGRRIGDQIGNTRVHDLRPQIRDIMYLWISLGLVAASIALWIGFAVYAVRILNAV